MTQTVALVGAAGGVGTTRLTVEFGATLARAGSDVALFDSAFGTQGLASYVSGTLSADVTALATEEAGLDATLYEHETDLPGELAICPASGPFERIARAQTAGAARRFESQLAAAGLSYDVVLVDTPPICGNHAIAAVNAADTRAIVTEDTPRGTDALSRMRERFDDIGVSVDAVLANRGSEYLDNPTARIPDSDVTAPGACPACAQPDETFAPAVADAVETVLDVTLDLDFPESDGIGSMLG